jgi:hypothetical protein
MKRWILAGAASAVLALSSFGTAWAEYKAEHRGGTMRLVARSAAGTLDPQINYTLQYWQIYQSVYSGLTASRKGLVKKASRSSQTSPRSFRRCRKTARPIPSRSARA